MDAMNTMNGTSGTNGPRTGARTCGDAGGVTKSGQPCRTTLNLSATNGRCLMHDLERIERRRAVRAAGGHATAEGRAERLAEAKASMPTDVPKAPRTLAQLARYLTWVLAATAERRLDPAVSRELVLGCRELRQTLDKSVLGPRLAKFKRQLRTLQADQRSRRGLTVR